MVVREDEIMLCLPGWFIRLIYVIIANTKSCFSHFVRKIIFQSSRCAELSFLHFSEQMSLKWKSSDSKENNIDPNISLAQVEKKQFLTCWSVSTGYLFMKMLIQSWFEQSSNDWQNKTEIISKNRKKSLAKLKRSNLQNRQQ